LSKTVKVKAFERYRCQNPECRRSSLIQNYSYPWLFAPGKTTNSAIWQFPGSGIREPARVLKISPITVIEEFKKSRHLEQVNTPLLQQMQTVPESVMAVRFR
jgi:transposase-like protein